MLIDIPDDAHHSDRSDVSDSDIREVRRAYLSESLSQTQFLDRIQDWIKAEAELVGRLSRGWLEFDETTDQNFHVEELGLRIGPKPEPVHELSRDYKNTTISRKYLGIARLKGL